MQINSKLHSKSYDYIYLLLLLLLLFTSITIFAITIVIVVVVVVLIIISGTVLATSHISCFCGRSSKFVCHWFVNIDDYEVQLALSSFFCLVAFASSKEAAKRFHLQGRSKAIFSFKPATEMLLINGFRGFAGRQVTFSWTFK